MVAHSHALRSVESEQADTIPTKPDLLSNEFLQKILRLSPSHGAATNGEEEDAVLQVTGFEWKPLEVGVISEVVSVTVFLRREGGKEEEGVTEKQLIAKFLRPEFPFESMFLVESKFYASFTTTSDASSFSSSASPLKARLPFEVPTPIFTSNLLIVLERVPAVKTYTCVQGCPADQITVLVSKLAQMHARFWSHDCDGLAVPAGIGSNLSGDAKKEKFPDLWAAYLDDVPLEGDDKLRLTALCERLSADSGLLKRAHDLVESGPQTLIHGDYHVANVLFSNAAADERVWLLDWATCGKGNPMRDLAFFFIVSVTHQDRRAQETRSLQLYYDIVTSKRSNDAAASEEAEASLLSIEDWTRHYKICVLNQFLILVVYDHLSKHLAANAKTEKLRSELDAHFRAVNLRACLSVLDNFQGDDSLELLLQGTGETQCNL